MYSRVKPQLFIIYTVVRILNKSNQTFSVLFAWQQETAASANRRQPARGSDARHDQTRGRASATLGDRGTGKVYPIDHLRKKASERSSAIAQPMKPAMHIVHGHGGVLRPASVATPLGNAHGAGQPMVIGPAKATGPAHSQHEAMCRMDQPLPCEMARV